MEKDEDDSSSSQNILDEKSIDCEKEMDNDQKRIMIIADNVTCRILKKILSIPESKSEFFSGKNNHSFEYMDSIGKEFSHYEEYIAASKLKKGVFYLEMKKVYSSIEKNPNLKSRNIIEYKENVQYEKEEFEFDDELESTGFNNSYSSFNNVNNNNNNDNDNNINFNENMYDNRLNISNNLNLESFDMFFTQKIEERGIDINSDYNDENNIVDSKKLFNDELTDDKEDILKFESLLATQIMEGTLSKGINEPTSLFDEDENENEDEENIKMEKDEDENEYYDDNGEDNYNVNNKDRSDNNERRELCKVNSSLKFNDVEDEFNDFNFLHSVKRKRENELSFNQRSFENSNVHENINSLISNSFLLIMMLIL
jgi:hypothetical protein